MAKKLKQGEKYPNGFIQKQILLKLCEKDKTPTSEILDFLKERFGIREQKNIREHHLKKLEKDKLIKRESAGRGHPVYWSVDSDAETFAKLLKVFVETEHVKDFLDSPYARHFNMDEREIRHIIGNVIFNHLQLMQLLATTVCPASEFTTMLEDLLTPGTPLGVVLKLGSQQANQDRLIITMAKMQEARAHQRSDS